MNPRENESEVRHNVTASRFEMEIDGRLAVAEYERSAGTMTMTHTLVPPELRGRGLAEQLVRAALEYARAEKLRVVPACSYVATFIQRHPEFQVLVA
jgi:hypothetical protein